MGLFSTGTSDDYRRAIAAVKAGDPTPGQRDLVAKLASQAGTGMQSDARAALRGEKK